MTRFTPRQHQLLLDSCHHDPRLPEYLERMLLEGPSDYHWPPAPGQYDPEEFPLYERVWVQIWHQGDIYPATYVAVPVLCEVVARFPAMNHAELLSQLVMIEYSRPRFEPLIKPDAETLTNYLAALDGLLSLLPAQLKMQDDRTPGGLANVRNILSLMAFAAGQQWGAILLGRHDPLIDHYSGELAPALTQAAKVLGQDDLPRAVRAEWQGWWDNFNALPQEPYEDLEF